MYVCKRKGRAGDAHTRGIPICRCQCTALGGVHTTVKMAATLGNVKVLFTPISSEQKQNGYRRFRIF